MFFPVLFDRFPFPAMLTSTLLKLADLFRTEYVSEANQLDSNVILTCLLACPVFLCCRSFPVVVFSIRVFVQKQRCSVSYAEGHPKHPAPPEEIH